MFMDSEARRSLLFRGGSLTTLSHSTEEGGTRVTAYHGSRSDSREESLPSAQGQASQPLRGSTKEKAFMTSVT